MKRRNKEAEIEHIYPIFEIANAPAYYRVLYDAVTKAIKDIEELNFGAAKKTLETMQDISFKAYLIKKEEEREKEEQKEKG